MFLHRIIQACEEAVEVDLDVLSLLLNRHNAVIRRSEYRNFEVFSDARLQIRQDVPSGQCLAMSIYFVHLFQYKDF